MGIHKFFSFIFQGFRFLGYGILATIGGVIFYLVLLYNTQELYGYVDTKGHFVIAPQYWEATEFYNGQASVVETYSSAANPYDNPTYSYNINHLGQTVSPALEHGPLKPEDDQLYPSPRKIVSKPDSEKDDVLLPHTECFGDCDGVPHINQFKKGYINLKTKEWVIPPKFDEALFFNQGMAWVMLRKKDLLHFWRDETEYWGLINKKGYFVLTPKCLKVGAFQEGLAPCKIPVTLGLYW